MKYLIGIVLIGLLASCGDADNFKSPIKCDEIDGLDWDEIYNGGPGVPSNYTGIIKKCRNGYIQVTQEYKNGKQDGLTIGYSNHYCGINYEIPYKNGRINGIRKDYDENGILRKTTEYENSAENGSVKEYYQNGQVKTEYIMKDGVGNVEFSKQWYKNGQLKSHCIYEETDEYAVGYYVVSYDCWDEDGNQIECERTAEDINNDI